MAKRKKSTKSKIGADPLAAMVRGNRKTTPPRAAAKKSEPKPRTIYVDDDTWFAIRAKALQERRTAADVVREALAKHVKV